MCGPAACSTPANAGHRRAPNEGGSAGAMTKGPLAGAVRLGGGHRSPGRVRPAVAPGRPARRWRRGSWCSDRRGNGPGPGHAPAFLPPGSGGVLVGPHDGGVRHQPLHIRLAAQGLEDGREHAALDPIVVALLHRRNLAVSLRQILPAAPRSGHPEHSFHEAAVVAPRTSLALAAPRHKRRDPRPLLARQPIAIRLRTQGQPPKISLESRSGPGRNPPSLNPDYAMQPTSRPDSVNVKQWTTGALAPVN